MCLSCTPSSCLAVVSSLVLRLLCSLTSSARQSRALGAAQQVQAGSGHFQFTQTAASALGPAASAPAACVLQRSKSSCWTLHCYKVPQAHHSSHVYVTVSNIDAQRCRQLFPHNSTQLTSSILRRLCLSAAASWSSSMSMQAHWHSQSIHWQLAQLSSTDRKSRLLGSQTDIPKVARHTCWHSS